MKSILKSIILTSLFVFTQQIIFAQEAEKTVSITVSGSGKTQEEAKQSALRSAIEQAFGAFISSKTEILNDQIVSDQIASVANGNIQSFSILNESQLPDSSWGVTLKALVSVSKLTSFVEAKGIAIEIKGGLFALNIKQQLLNEQGEIKAIYELIGLLHEPMQISFDYTIKSSEPISLDADSKNWEIPIQVAAIANKNMDFCANYCLKTLSALSLSEVEVLDYQKVNKKVFPVFLNYLGVTKKFYLRKENSIKLLNTFTSQWKFYINLFDAVTTLDTLNGEAFKTTSDFDFEDKNNWKAEIKNLNFLKSGQTAATFVLNDKRSLFQIEQMSGYLIKPRGVVSQFKFGGIVLFEENGHGVIVSLFDLDYLKWWDSNIYVNELVLNGYSDWTLPNNLQLNQIYQKMKVNNIGGLSSQYYYWSSDRGYGNGCRQFFENGEFDKTYDENGTYVGSEKDKFAHIRAIRTF
jgi:hypothetical protein